MTMDHKQQAQSRIYAQYRDKPKLVDWIGIDGQLGNQIEVAFDDVATSYDIDTAGTDELDVIGRIVGQDRAFTASVAIDVYECGDTDSECGDPEVQLGSVTVSQDEQLSNEYFRTAIKSKIQKNINDATIDGIITSIKTILSNPGNVVILDNEDMSFSFIYSAPITDIEKVLIEQKDLIPKPQGVRLESYFSSGAEYQAGEGYSCGDVAECTGLIEP